MNGGDATAATVALAGDVIPIFPMSDATTGTLRSDSLRAIAAELARADLAIANFELALTGVVDPREKMFTMRGDPALAPDVARLGIGVLTVANNHTLDQGWAGLCESIGHLRGAGLSVIGAGETLAAALRPAVCRAGAVTVGVLPFSCLLPVGSAAGASTPGIAPLRIETAYEIDPLIQVEEPGEPAAIRVRTRPCPDALDAAQNAVVALAQAVDVVVVSIHWGFGGGDELAEYQRPLAHALIEAGADLIHGHHMHAPQAIEFRAGKPIVYGPGAFISQETLLPSTPEVRALNDAMSPDGFVAEVTFGTGGPPAVRLRPHRLSSDDRLPVRDPDVLGRVGERLARLSAPLGTSVFERGGELVAEAA